MARGEETRNKIIEAAVSLFADRGYHGTTIAQIAKSAGLSEGALYRHFDGKEELFNECIMPVLTQALTLIEPGAILATDLRSFTQKRAEMRLKFFQENYARYKVLFSELTYRPELLAKILDLYFEKQKNLQSMADQLNGYSEIKRKRNYFLIMLGQVMAFWNMFHMSKTIQLMADQLPKGYDIMSEEHILEDYTDFFLYGIAGKSEDKT